MVNLIIAIILFMTTSTFKRTKNKYHNNTGFVNTNLSIPPVFLKFIHQNNVFQFVLSHQEPAGYKKKET